MKFVPRDLGESAENSSGGGRRGMRREALSLAALVVVTLAALYFLIALATDWAVARISPEREADLFGDFAGVGSEEPVPEPLQERWEQARAVLGQLTRHEAVVPLDYRLVYSPDPAPNAFAVPGGSIVLTRGLLEALEEKIAVAFVIAHELGHFTGRHHLRRLGRQIGFGTAVRILTGGGADRLLRSASDWVALSYSRKQEAEADRFALDCLDAVYGSHDGAERLFEILEAANGLPDWAYMFATHPANADRIKTIRETDESTQTGSRSSGLRTNAHPAGLR